MTHVGFDTSMPATSACVIRGRRRAGLQPGAGRWTRLLRPPEHSAELLPAARRLLERGADGLGRRARDRGRGRARHVHRAADRSRDRARPRAGAAACRCTRCRRSRRWPPGSPLRPAPGRPLLPLIDAQRGQVFASLYRRRRRRSSSMWGPRRSTPRSSCARRRSSTPTPVGGRRLGARIALSLEAAGIEVPAPDPACTPSARCRCAGSAWRSSRSPRSRSTRFT